MSADLHVKGIIPADEKFYKMKAILDACEEADVSLPKEVESYFGQYEPDDTGILREINPEAIEELEEEYDSGFDIDLRKLNPDIKIIRVSISY